MPGSPRRRIHSTASPIILFGCPKWALLNPMQAPPHAMATRSRGSLGSIAVQSLCPIPYTLRRAIPPSGKKRRLSASQVGEQLFRGHKLQKRASPLPRAAPCRARSGSQLCSLPKACLCAEASPKCPGLREPLPLTSHRAPLCPPPPQQVYRHPPTPTLHSCSTVQSQAEVALLFM